MHYLIDRVHYYSGNYNSIVTVINYTGLNTEIINGVEVAEARYSLIIFFSDYKLSKKECIELIENLKLDAPNPDSYVNKR